MCGKHYPARVKTIQMIRMENYRRLLAELKGHLGREPSGKEMADALGISGAYVSQLKTGKRDNIDDDAARGMETRFNKEVGWMDNDPELWPFETIRHDRFSRLPERFKGMAEQELRRVIEEWESKGSGLGGSGHPENDLPSVATG